MIIKETVIFKADKTQVWDLLINPEMTKQYMFGCELISDWKVGSPVLWKGKTEDGSEVVYVKGKLLEFEEGQKITMTTFDPNAGWEDIPINHVNFSYELMEVENGTELTVIQGDFAGAIDGQKRYEESKAGWSQMVIPLMKKLVE